MLYFKYVLEAIINFVVGSPVIKWRLRNNYLTRKHSKVARNLQVRLQSLYNLHLTTEISLCTITEELFLKWARVGSYRQQSRGHSNQDLTTTTGLLRSMLALFFFFFSAYCHQHTWIILFQARNIRNKPVVNRDPQNTRLAEMQNEIQVSRCWKTETWWEAPLIWRAKWILIIVKCGLLRQIGVLNKSASY